LVREPKGATPRVATAGRNGEGNPTILFGFRLTDGPPRLTIHTLSSGFGKGLPMKLSTRGRYAARAMLELARHHGHGSLSIDRIAENQHISKRYLEHIFARLREAGIVSGTRGSRGGYALCRAPDTITIGEVVRAVEGPLGPVHCVDDPDSCPKVGHCATHNLWDEAARALNGPLDAHTVASLFESQEHLDAVAEKKSGAEADDRVDSTT